MAHKFASPHVLDGSLVRLADADLLTICSSLPTTYAAATDSAMLGEKAEPSVGAPADASPNGRRVTVAAVTEGGSVEANGTATHWALVDDAESRLLAAGELSASQVVTMGNSFTLPEFDIRLPAHSDS